MKMTYSDEFDNENKYFMPVDMLRGGEHFEDVQERRKSTNISE